MKIKEGKIQIREMYYSVMVSLKEHRDGVQVFIGNDDSDSIDSGIFFPNTSIKSVQKVFEEISKL